MRIYNRFARGIRNIFRRAKGHWRIDTPQTRDCPAVYVVHHQNMHGPIHAIGLMPFESHIWSLHVFLEKKSCFDQFFHYTFCRRYGWPRMPAYAVSKMLSLIVPGVLRSFGAIPVYHDARALKTMRASIRALMQGESVTICPDVRYDDRGAGIGDIYRGFLLLGSLYEKQTGNPLPFVPVCCSTHQKRILFGKPITLGQEVTAETIDTFARTIVLAMNEMAAHSGDVPS